MGDLTRGMTRNDKYAVAHFFAGIFGIGGIGFLIKRYFGAGWGMALVALVAYIVCRCVCLYLLGELGGHTLEPSANEPAEAPDVEKPPKPE